jgi:hypothetical protein
MPKTASENKQKQNCAISLGIKIRDSKQTKNTCNIGEIFNCYIING